MIENFFTCTIEFFTDIITNAEDQYFLHESICNTPSSTIEHNSACVTSIILTNPSASFFGISGEHLEKRLTLKSAEVILMAVFDERKVRDVKLHSQILPACRFLKVLGIRGHSKPTVTNKLAKAVIDHGYVTISSENLASLQISDVNVSSDKDIHQDLLIWRTQVQFSQGRLRGRNGAVPAQLFLLAKTFSALILEFYLGMPWTIITCNFDCNFYCGF